MKKLFKASFLDILLVSDSLRLFLGLEKVQIKVHSIWFI